MIDTFHRDYITCPRCGHEHRDRTDYPDSLRYDGDTTEIDCEKCEHPISVEKHVTYTFSTFPPRSERDGEE